MHVVKVGRIVKVFHYKEFPMYNRQRVWLWSAAVLSMVMGFILVLNDSGAGWFLIIMGIAYFGVSTRAGQSLATSNPNLVRWGIIVMTLLLVLLAVVVGAAVLLK